MSRFWLTFIVFACIGITTEVCFTACQELLRGIGKRKRDWGLKGHSFAWMIPIYGSIAWIFPPIQAYAFALPLALRLLIYAIAIWTIEFISGWLLEKLTGRCPWHYQSRLAIKGYIRLDFLPLWMGFGWIIEQVFAFLEGVSW